MFLKMNSNRYVTIKPLLGVSLARYLSRQKILKINKSFQVKSGNNPHTMVESVLASVDDMQFQLVIYKTLTFKMSYNEFSLVTHKSFWIFVDRKCFNISYLNFFSSWKVKSSLTIVCGKYAAFTPPSFHPILSRITLGTRKIKFFVCLLFLIHFENSFYIRSFRRSHRR